MELFLENVSAKSFDEAERFAREKAAGWFGEDARCLKVMPTSIALYDQDKDWFTQSFAVTVKHKIDNPSFGFSSCRYCHKRFDKEGRRV